MTREECIALLNRYANYNGVGIPNLEGCKESMKVAADLLSQPSLPSDLDEAAEDLSLKYSIELEECGITASDSVHYRTGFKAGAEWMAGQGVRAHCVESANLVSESSDARLHLITLLYEENKCTPYVRGGDNIDIIILKK